MSLNDDDDESMCWSDSSSSDDSSDDESIVVMSEFLDMFEDRSGRLWVHPWNKPRTEEKSLTQKMNNMRKYPDKFANFTRMSIDTFDYLLDIIKEDISKINTNWRESITPAERLFLTLRFLAAGEKFQYMHLHLHVGATTIGEIIYHTCKIIWKHLQPIYMPVPSTEEYRSIANRFSNLWNFPNCIGAIDCKHIRIQTPANSGSMYFNYKHYASIKLQAVVDAEGKFMFIDVGDYGRNNDSGTFTYSNFGKLFYNNDLGIPPPQTISTTNDTKFPFVFLGDEAYPLCINFMTPFAKKGLNNRKRIYNYRHSRARRIVECAFGMMTKKFRVLETELLVTPEHAEIITAACCILHNMIQTRKGSVVDVFDFLTKLEAEEDDGNLRCLSRPSSISLKVRERISNYFTSEGAVPWQEEYAHLV